MFFAVHSCLMCTYVFDCKFGANALWLPGHVLPFSVVFPKHTAKSHGSVLWSSTWSSACWLDAVREPLTVTGALIPVFPVPRSSPARQVGCREQYYRKHRDKPRVGLGGWVLIFVSLWFCLGLVGFCCGVVLPLFCFVSGRRWRDDRSCEVHRCPLHSVRRRWLKTDGSAVCLHW